MRLPYETDGGAATRARLGLIVLHVDETIETEFRHLIDLEGVALYCTRVPSGTELTEETLNAMAAEIPAAARLLPPATRLDVVGYACTSGATIIGPENVAQSIREARPMTDPGTFAETAITDPLTAVKAACRTLGVQRLGFVTPYVPSVSAAMRAALEADGLTIAAFGSFEQSEERLVARITPASIHGAILHVGRAADCDGVFVSCTNVRTLEILEAAEHDLGVPVISSNQVLAWHMLRRAGIPDRRPGCGTLLRV
jgi:maleate isomerase